MAHVVRGARARSVFASLAVFATLGCADETGRVRLVFRVENDAFRPHYVDITWGEPGKPHRIARVPGGSASFPTTGAELGSALIILSDAARGERRFVVRGKRSGATGEQRVSGAVLSIPWQGEGEVQRTVVLGCYDDPDEAEPLPGCGNTPTPDAGTPEVGTPVDVGGEAAPGPG